MVWPSRLVLGKKFFWIWFIYILEGCVLVLHFFILTKCHLWNTLMFTLTCWNIPRYQAGSELVRQTWERLKCDTEQPEGRDHCMGLIFSFQLMSGWKNFSTLLCLFSSQSPVLLFQLLHLLLCLALQPKYFLENESNMELLIRGTRDAYHLLLSRFPLLLLLGQSCHLLLIVLA